MRCYSERQEVEMTVTLNFNDEEAALLSEYAEKSQVSVENFILKAAMKSARNAAYLAKLDRADEQIRNGQVVVKTMEELEAMAE